MPTFRADQLTPAAGGSKIFRADELKPISTERQSVQVGSDVYTGTPEMIAAFKAAGERDPEAAGLSIEGRKHTWRDTAESVAKAPARVAVPILGGIGGSALAPGVGTVGGSAAASAGLEALLNKAGVGEEGESATDAALRGAGEGAIMGLIPGAAAAGEKVVGGVGKALLGKTAGKVAGFAGEAAGAALPGALAEGRLPTKEELLLSGALTGGARGLGKILPSAAPKIGESTPVNPDRFKSKLFQTGEKLQKPQLFSEREKTYRKAFDADQKAATKLEEAQGFSKAKLESLTPSEQQLTSAEATTRLAANEAARERADILGPIERRVKKARAAKGGLDEELRLAQAEHAGSEAELERARQEFNKKLQDEAAAAEPELKAALDKGTFEVTSEEFTSRKGMRTEQKLGARRSTSDFDIPYETYRPDLITAESYATYPKLRALAQEVWGPTFLSDIGSHGMANSTKLLNQYVRQNTPEAVKGKGKEWAEKLAKLMLGDDELRRFIDPAALDAVKAVAAGKGTPQTGATFFKSFEKALRGRASSPELTAARAKFAETNLGQKEAKANQKLSPEAAEYAAAQQEAKEADDTLAQSPKQAERARQADMLKRLKESRDKGIQEHAATPEFAAAEAARKAKSEAHLRKSQALTSKRDVYGDNPRSPLQVMGDRLGNAYIASQVGGEIGYNLFGTSLGRAAGRAAGYAAGGAVKPVVSGMHKLGTILKSIAASPPGIRAKLKVVERLSHVKGEKAALAALHVIARQSPEVRAWLKGSTARE